MKFFDAYLRTLRIADVPESQAANFYAKGRTAPLARDDYLALQDFLWRHILLEAGKITLPVHIHSSLGVPPFLRSLESDVRNLEDVLADPKFFATPIVLIHGGGPWDEIAIYLALKPNVWLDISSRGFLYPVPDFADSLRKFLLFAPEKVLYGTDAASYPSVPGGADVQHLMLSRATRDALYVALAGLVRDGVIDETRAVEMGAASCARTRADCMAGNSLAGGIALGWMRGCVPNARISHEEELAPGDGRVGLMLPHPAMHR